ncbi:Sugar transport protein 14 [Platanthera guangdongensis]|uniref:Sugar transport protein 14 n=1 Tax=Platanthera guangdongensis TaxID=2320717 RepID=A0ABR2N2M3_9ASPA
MDDFLKEFFPKTYERKHAHLHETDYCKYDNQLLTLFTSSLYFAGLLSTFAASPVTRKYGRRVSILTGAVSFFLGGIINAAAVNIFMLILGRILLGIGIGFGNQAIIVAVGDPAQDRLHEAELEKRWTNCAHNQPVIICLSVFRWEIGSESFLIFSTERVVSRAMFLAEMLWATLKAYRRAINASGSFGLVIQNEPARLVVRDLSHARGCINVQISSVKPVTGSSSLSVRNISPKIRGAVNQLFQLTTCLGILVADLINYFTEKIHPWGWRLSLGLAAVPATLMFAGGLFLPETPNSLVERGMVEEARRVLEKVRGTAKVDAELEDLKDASAASQAVKHPFRNLLRRKNRPQLIIGAIGIPAFQQLTGQNSILFYAPVIFQSLGFGSGAALYSSIITGSMLVVGAIVSMLLVDRMGRRFLFMEAGIQMIISNVIVAVTLALEFGRGVVLSKGISVLLVVSICAFVAAFGWSWGPLGWLVPTEIFSGNEIGGAEHRRVRQSVFHSACCSGIPHIAMPSPVRNLRSLRLPHCDHDSVHLPPPA